MHDAEIQLKSHTNLQPPIGFLFETSAVSVKTSADLLFKCLLLTNENRPVVNLKGLFDQKTCSSHLTAVSEDKQEVLAVLSLKLILFFFIVMFHIERKQLFENNCCSPHAPCERRHWEHASALVVPH